MQCNYTVQSGFYGGLEIYTKKEEELFIGSAKLKRIEYAFWKGKLVEVLIRTKGLVNFQCLKDAVFEKFGEGHRI